jgi:hypothetical protein
MIQSLFQPSHLVGVFVLLLYFGIPLFLIVAGWRWAAAMLGEIRAIRRDLDEIAGTRDREHLTR